LKEVNKKLKVIIMSATINLSELEQSLKNRSRTLELNERKYSLKIEYLPNDTLVLKNTLERKVMNALDVATKTPGHILVFLSGMFEIKKCEEIIFHRYGSVFEIIILHGEVGGVAIDDSFYDLKRRRIILSTNVAESSVTIPGVRTVIDSGFHKTSRLNPVTRLPIVELRKISQSSSIQRANRASREADGVCFRLYSEMDFQTRDQFDTPEINRVDLSELIITCAEIFNSDISHFTFLSPLKESEVNKAKKYLEQIGLLSDGKILPNAKRLARFPFHPRIAKILDEASKGSILSFSNALNYLADLIEPKAPNRFKQVAKIFFKGQEKGPDLDLEKLMLFGYVDQIAKLKENKLVHMNGESYVISPKIHDEMDPSHSLWIILDLDNKNQVIQMLPIEEDWLYDLPFFPIEESDRVDFSLINLKLNVERVSRIGAIVLSKEKVLNVEHSKEVIDQVAKKVLSSFKEYLQKNEFKRLHLLEKYSKNKIEEFDFDTWFKTQIPFLLADSNYSLEVILNAYVTEVFEFLNDENSFDLDKDLPLYLQLHDKRKVAILYDETNGVHCESYIQDFYGLGVVPSILQGKEKMKIHLLGPHKRALQVTMDLVSFWDKTYKELYGELKRDYPRHYWPLDPKSALPILLLKNVK
ncbi:MAG: hypothetical protein K2Q18_05360, partial [Bdellovibrionales bacterium]|nr:hypothetical protein [Bdellovibrionales bacterium]